MNKFKILFSILFLVISVSCQPFRGAGPSETPSPENDIIISTFESTTGKKKMAYMVQGDSNFYKFVQYGDIEAAREYISKHPESVYKKSGDGFLPVNFAVESGNLPMVKLLIENNADINGMSELGSTPLRDAARCGYFEIVEYLVLQGAKIDEGLNGVTPLHDACNNGERRIAEYLMEKGADVNAATVLGHTPLHFTAGIGETETGKLLVDRGADVNAQDKSGASPLHFSAFSGQTDFVRILLAGGANVNIRDNNGNTPLHHSVLGNQPGAAEILLEAGADPGALNLSGKTPLTIETDKQGDEVRDLIRKRAKKS